ncbi:dorsal-ventral patterning tolloid-like protein 1 [Pyxicephalus adspersus]|uniref:dorsal-ventral patterning tolloid-like protein 1 n=1 Tax=Pyxicephalus adspersus TaxID=30357 RepID=UPI003B5B9C41
MEIVRKCGGPLTRGWGSITSPFYPSSYPPNTLCTWEITTPQNTIITISIYIESLENSTTCSFDYVEISDGYLGSPILAKICQPGSYYFFTTSNIMTVVFRSDGSIEGNGFDAQFYNYYPAVPDTTTSTTTTTTTTTSSQYTSCGGYLTQNSGVITSPMYPQYYPANSRCVWQITATSNFTIDIYFTSFNLEIHPTCDFDYVKVYDGNLELGKMCGNETSSFSGSTSSMTIEFKSDGSVQNTGFKASYNFAKHYRFSIP